MSNNNLSFLEATITSEKTIAIGKYLPIGTIVKINGIDKIVMITGFNTSNDGKKIYDYNGCYYPDGIKDNESMIVFDHISINSICYMGFVDTNLIKTGADVLLKNLNIK